MKYNIQEIDKETLLQNSLNFKIRLYITDRNKNILDEVSGVIGGGSSAKMCIRDRGTYNSGQQSHGSRNTRRYRRHYSRGRS